MWWIDEVRAKVRRKESTWKEMLAAKDERSKERYMETYKEEKKRLKGAYIRAKIK